MTTASENAVNKAVVKGITSEECMNYYSEYCLSGRYEQDLVTGDTWNAPIVASEAIIKLFADNREDIAILDIAAGTGYVGAELQKKGFFKLDALDPCQEMIEKARGKNIYQNFFCDFLGGSKCTIKNDFYDCTVVSGAMCEGHIPCSGLHEMIRVVKPGGVVCMVVRENYLDIEEYKNRLEPLMKQLEDQGKWVKIERRIYPDHCYGKTGVLFLFRVKCFGN